MLIDYIALAKTRLADFRVRNVLYIYHNKKYNSEIVIVKPVALHGEAKTICGDTMWNSQLGSN